MLPSHASAALEPVATTSRRRSPRRPRPHDNTAGPSSGYHPLARFTAYTSRAGSAPGRWVSVRVAGRGGCRRQAASTRVATTVIVSRRHRTTTVAVSAQAPRAPTRVVTASSRAHRLPGSPWHPSTRPAITRFRLTGGHARLRVVVEGYQQAGRSGTTFHPLAAATVLPPHRLGAGASRSVPIVGAARTGLPSNGQIAAVALAVTVLPGRRPTTVTAYARGHGVERTSRRRRAPRRRRRRAWRSSHGRHSRRCHAAQRARPRDAQCRRSRATGPPIPTGASFARVTPTVVYDGTTARERLAQRHGRGRCGLASGQPDERCGALDHGRSAVRPGVPRGRADPPRHPVERPGQRRRPLGGHHDLVVARLTGAEGPRLCQPRMRLTVSVVGWYGPTAPAPT